MDLMGLTEIAELLHVSRQRADQLSREHPDFPAPADTIAAGRIWLRHDVEAWAVSTDRYTYFATVGDEAIANEDRAEVLKYLRANVTDHSPWALSFGLRVGGRAATILASGTGPTDIPPK